ncbi:MAG: helix-turn-helix transcriptional regulator [Acidobacteriota bacterium]
MSDFSDFMTFSWAPVSPQAVEYGRQVAASRENLGWSPCDLIGQIKRVARLETIDAKELNELERGKRVPKAALADALTELLGVPPLPAPVSVESLQALHALTGKIAAYQQVHHPRGSDDLKQVQAIHLELSAALAVDPVDYGPGHWRPKD